MGGTPEYGWGAVYRLNPFKFHSMGIIQCEQIDFSISYYLCPFFFITISDGYGLARATNSLEHDSHEGHFHWNRAWITNVGWRALFCFCFFFDFGPKPMSHGSCGAPGPGTRQTIQTSGFEFHRAVISTSMWSRSAVRQVMETDTYLINTYGTPHSTWITSKHKFLPDFQVMLWF